MNTRLSQRIGAARRAGRPVVNGWMMTPEPAVLEVLAGQGWDCVTLDLQHGQIDAGQARTLARVARGFGLPLMARLAWNDTAHISRLLDDGFEGLICPMVNSIEDALHLSDAAYYPPRGSRSFGPVRASAVHGPDYWREIADHLVLLAMIETGAALDALPAILSLDGISGVYVGPADLGMSLTEAPTREPETHDLISRIDSIRASAQAAGKIAAVHNTTAPHAARMACYGWDIVTGPADIGLLAKAGADALATIQAALPLKGDTQ